MSDRQPPASSTPRRRDIPHIWLFTDERMSADPIAALRALPPRSGVVFRYYATPAGRRAKLLAQVRRVARARGHVLLIGGDTHRSFRHGTVKGASAVSTAVHTAAEAALARRARAAIVFISPVFPTRSHVGGKTLAIAGFARLARIATGKAIALGGMNARNFRRLRGHGAHGWGAIDALDVEKGKKAKRGLAPHVRT